MTDDHHDDSDQPIFFALPAVRLPPVADLAPAARNCGRVRLLRRLAEWAEGRRTTKAGSLTLAEARAAVRDLRLPGDQGPGRTPARSAAGFPELQDLWELAVELELLQARGGRVEAGPALEALRYDRDRDVVEFWTALLAVTLDPSLPSLGVQAGLVPMLIRLYVDRLPVKVEELVLEIAAAAFGVDGGSVGSTPEVGLLTAAYEPAVRSQLADLEEIDAVVLDEDRAILTDLCRYGLSSWFEEGGLSAPVVTDLAKATVSELLDLGTAVDGPEALEDLFQEWVSAYGAEAAVDAIVEHARGGTPLHRVAAFGLLDRVNDAAEGAVRACLEDEDLRPHAVAWLMARGLTSEEPRLDDLQRLYVDLVAAELNDDEESVRESIVEIAGHGESDQVDLIDSLWQSDHPQTLEVLEALSRYHPDPAAARAARKAAMRVRSAVEEAPTPSAPRRTAKKGEAYQLKITLLDTKPPVWRRVEVPGDIKLSGLHAVIQTAMGWSGGHLHQFLINGVEYSEPDEDMPDDVLDESDVELAGVSAEGDQLLYVYDFGDNWRHEVKVEKVLPASKSGQQARCVAGGRACPPEDVGGVWGFADFLEAYYDPAHEEYEQFHDWLGDDYDAAAFDPAEVNGQLRRLRLR